METKIFVIQREYNDRRISKILCDPVLTRRSRSAASVDCADPVENQTFFTKSKILEKVVKQVQGDGELKICTLNCKFSLTNKQL